MKTWLFRIAHNVTIDYLRKNKPLRVLESFLLNKKDTSPLPEDILEISFFKKGTPIKYYVSLAVAAFLLFLLIAPSIFNFSDGEVRMDLSSERYTNNTEEGYSIEIISMEKEQDGTTLILEVENESEFNFVENEVLIKSFEGGGFDYLSKDTNWMYQPSDTYVDYNSVLLNVEEVEGTFETIHPQEIVKIEFFVPKEFANNNNYEVMYQSNAIPDLETGESAPSGPGLTIHVIDLENDFTGLFEVEEVTNAKLSVLIFAVLFTGISLFLITRYVKDGKKKFILSVSLLIVVTAVYFGNIALKDDTKEIEKATQGINWPMMDVVHIEYLDDGEAIAFYDHGAGSVASFGHAMMKKSWLFGWENKGGSSGQMPRNTTLGWGGGTIGDIGANEKFLVRGRILDDEIDEVLVVTGEQENLANIVELKTGERAWYFISNDQDSFDRVVYGLSEDGEIIEEVP